MMEPREIAERAETSEAVAGVEESFAGYGIMGLPFRSGHVLALRRFASSVGPRYTSVWHRAPAGNWTFYADAPAPSSCNRYFGAAVDRFQQTEIGLRWTGPRSLTLEVPAAELTWSVDMADTAFTRAMNAVSPLIPARMLRSPLVLDIMGGIAGKMLGGGRLRMHGRVPNGQTFIANPRLLWVIPRSTARMGAEEFGPLGPLSEQAFLGDFAIPQRGLFAGGFAFFERFDPARHLEQATRAAG